MIEAPTRAWMALARASAWKWSDNGRAADAAVLAALTAWLASRDAVKERELPDSVLALLTGIGISVAAATTVGAMVLAKPMSGRTRHGSPTVVDDMTATRMVAAEEPEMRAQYLLAAAKRLTDPQDWDAALKLEHRYLDMHVAAGRRRREAARQVDAIGTAVWVWRTRGDDRVTPDCAAMEGRLFHRDHPPPKLPGSMHPSCRCRAVGFGNGPLLGWGTRPV